ncbi:hypothetical protein FH972_022603 [Carpinus fangiana]|uniref:MICOS complex subunit n=1 Tax=Carpinus fangiana TaxID=176857 RepID=A0A5N6KT44_9ROSI|nr:hypothetical protein FH972_022603 [Carpinus fangiana]
MGSPRYASCITLTGFKQNAAAAATGVLVASAVFYPRTAYAETPERESVPIYDDVAASPDPSSTDAGKKQPTTTPERRVAPQTSVASSPSPTDRLEKYVRAARLQLYEVASKGEDSLNNFMTQALNLETSVAQTVANLAPAPESREKLMPGVIYVLVASMAGSILTRRSNILLRATVPLAFGVGAGYTVIPVTMHNVEDLIWKYEEKYPVVRDTHLQVRERVVDIWQTGKAHSGMALARAEETLEDARKKMQDWTLEMTHAKLSASCGFLTLCCIHQVCPQAQKTAPPAPGPRGLLIGTVGGYSSPPRISTATSLPTFDLKSGFPPHPLDLDQFAPDVLLSDTNLSLNGEQLIAVKKDIAAALIQPLGTTAPAPAPAPALPTSAPPPRNTQPAEDAALDPPEIPVPSHAATLVLRVMPDDNSCLFRAFAAAALGTATDTAPSTAATAAADALSDSTPGLRALVAAAIAAQPTLYTAAVLDKDPAAYRAWIQRPDAWGGAIELGILAAHFGLEVASVSVQDGRVDRFNEGAPHRVLLVYSGIHYDVAALSPSAPPHARADLPAELDVRVFAADDEVVLDAARELGRRLRDAHYFTDTAGFGVVCNVAGCGWRGTGEKDAVKHATETGHYDFGEAA